MESSHHHPSNVQEPERVDVPEDAEREDAPPPQPTREDLVAVAGACRAIGSEFAVHLASQIDAQIEELDDEENGEDKDSPNE